MSTTNHNLRLLAVDPNEQWLAFVVLEGEEELIDWGLKKAITATETDKNRGCLKHIRYLIDRYQPDVIVLENATGKGSRRCLRVQAMIRSIVTIASRKKVSYRRISRFEIQNTFAPFGATTKYQIAVEIAKRYPELAPRLPRYRKPWMTEDARMNIFDALALALAIFRERVKAINESNLQAEI